MATPIQYGFDLAELAKALIKEQGIHEGRWMVAFEFNFGGGLFGMSPSDVAPGGFIQIKRVILTQPGDPAPPAHLILDAAEVNPRTPRTEKSRRAKKSPA